VLICADPPLNVAVATTVCESRKETVPVGVPVPLTAATFAVKVTLAPAVICVAETVSKVLVFIFAGAETTTVTTVEVDTAKFASPEYAAVMLCDPTVSDAVLKVAVPPLKVAVPSEFAPSLNVTVPVGVPLPDCGATVAVNVTSCPLVNCVFDALREVLVLIFAGAETTTVTTVEVDAAKFASPEYAAVMLCDPTVSDDVLKVAVPPLNVAVPSEFAPSLNVTVPVGVPLPDCGATVAVNVTLCLLVNCAFDALSEVVVAAGEAPDPAVKTKTVTE
jgi:hypothetical protein